MKNLKLNLKGLYGYRHLLLFRSPQPRDNREMSERKPSEERTLLAPVPQRFVRYAAMLIMLLTLGVGQMWGANNTEENRTVYYAVPASVVGSYEVRINSNIGDGGTWRQNTMSCVGTYNNGAYVVYQGNAVEKYGGVDGIQFQLYDDKGTWKDQEVAIDTWKTYDKIEGKMFIYGTTINADWSTYSTDGSITYKIYFVNKDNWANPYAYAYNTNCSNNGTWPGAAMSSASKTHDSSGKAIYSITLSSRLYKVIFSNNGSSQLSAEDCYDDNVSKMYYNGSWYTLQYRVTLDDEGGNGDGTASVNAVCGSAMTTITPPTKDDYTFAGYYTATSGSGTKYYNANGTSANTWPSDGTGPTTLHAHWTQEPGVTGLSVSAGDVYSGENTITLTATRNSAASSSNIQYQVKVPGGSWTNIGDAVNSLTMTYSPTSGHGTYEFRAYPSGYSVNNREASKTVYEHWTIYVRDHVDNWGSMYLYLYDNTASTAKSSWPGTACPKYNSTDKWYAVTLDSKWPNFILNNSTKQLLGGGSIETDKSTYPNGSYWYTQWHSDGTGGDSGKKFYTLASASVSVPTVTITSATVISSTQIKLVGNITSCGGDGNTADDMKEVGFNIGSGDVTAACTSGTTFTKVFTGLTAGTTYTVKAYATNVKGKGETSTQSVTTRAGGTYTIHVRIPKNNAAPYLYAYTDDEDGKCDGTKEENATWAGAAMTLEHSGTAFKWYSYLLNKTYNKFIVSENGSKQGETQTAPQTETCYFYNSGSDGTKCGTMGCPPFTPSLMIETTAGGGSYTYHDMSGSGSYTKTVTLAAKSTYKFKPVYGGEWLGKSSTTLTRGSNSTGSLDASNETALQITTDAAGSYTFTYNSSENTITVTYPTAYVVTYNAVLRSGSGSYKSGDPSAQATGPIAVTSTDYVLAGKDVTFTAAAANTGYTFQGWFDTDEPTIGTTVPLSSDTDDDSNRFTYTASSIGRAVTVYAVYTEDMHTVTLTVDNGSITTPDSGDPRTVSAGISTGASIASSAAYGYVFNGWTEEGGSSNVTFGNNKSESTTIHATADATIKANYFPHWSVAGSKTETPSGDAGDPMGDWDLYTNGIDNFTQDPVSKKWSGWVDIDLPANTTFYFKIRDLNNTKWYSANSEMTYSNHTDWTMYDNVSENCRITTAGKGTYKFTWNETDEKLTVTYPTSYTVTYNVSTFYNEDASHDYDNTTGGSISYKKDNDSIVLTSGKYVADGGTMTFKATPASGYTFAGWYKNQACSSEYTDGSDGADIDDGVLTLTIADNNKTVYAKFTENMTTVTFAHNSHGHVEIGGATVTSTTTGVTTTRALVAVPDDGYYLASWTLSDGADFVLEDKSDAEDVSVTLRGSGAGTASTLTANFVELDKVYFKNWDEGSSAKLMENVYVYFDITWNNETPTKAVTSSRNSDDHLYAQMTEISNNIYWAYVPRVFTKKSGDEKNIGFANVKMTENNFKFYSGNTSTIAIAATRGDYNRAINMFVPCHTPKKTNANYVDYYDDGYWKNYGLAGEKSGYKILRWDGSKYVNPASKGTGDDYQFVVIDDNTISYELRIDNTTDEHHNRFKIYTVANTSYTTAKGSPSNPGITITTANCNSLIGLKDYETNNNPIFEITPTSDGIYTLIIDQSADTMTLKVDYPLAIGDYMLVHSYNDGTAKTTQSDVIKSGEIATRTYSMFIDNKSSHSPSLKLKKCTAISDSKPTWSSGTDVSMTGFGTPNFTADTIGVFQFNVSINVGTPADDTDDAATLSNIAVYKGEFYIKTDIAPGGWTAYKANVMEKNTITFDKSKSSTFDRSFCHWIGNTTTNIKCVIANDYGIAISDTLESDDILGGSSQYLPHAAHVRFSYNSTTNELKRTYLNITGTDSLILEGSTDDEGATFTIHDTRDGDGAAFTNNKATLSSLSNFTYYVDVKAREKARARLSAKYNNVVQDLIGSTAGVLEGEGVENSTVEVLGGDGSTYKAIRIIYDFKTNYLISAWLANSDDPLTESKVLDADLIIIREGQGDARQIKFSGDYSITEIGKVYGVMEFNKWTLNNKNKEGEHETLSPALSPYERDLYWISFPFDVKLSDAFGMGTYGIHWIIERYDGKGRAKNGFWADSESNWKFVTPYQRDSGFVMNANEGYILALDLDELKDGEGESLVWDNGMTEAYLYFPSKDDVGSIQKTSKTVTFANQSEYECRINRPTPDGNRTIKDSYWHCIGVPSYAEKDTNVNTSYSTGDIPNVDWTTQDLPFLYEWRSNDNSLAPRKTSEFTFKPMYSYLVQYSKDAMLWKTVNATPAAVAARMTETPNLEYELALLREDDEQDRTYVRMTDDENVSTGFEFNYDLSKEMNRNRGNIWTVTADTVQVAGNSQPHPLTTTVVPVGVKIATNGEYTFSMPEGTNGGDVWIIDNANSSRTNLGLMDYTVNLTTGTYEGRFSLEFPVQNVVTEIENAANANANANADVRKVFVGGRLYILRDGKAYDATGAQVR